VGEGGRAGLRDKPAMASSIISSVLAASYSPPQERAADGDLRGSFTQTMGLDAPRPMVRFFWRSETLQNRTQAEERLLARLAVSDLPNGINSTSLDSVERPVANPFCISGLDQKLFVKLTRSVRCGVPLAI
jgi:hypothetical protein